VTIQTIEGRQSLAEDVDDAEFIGKLLAAHGDPDLETISFLGTFTRAGSNFRATLLDTERDVLFFRMETGTGPGRQGVYPRNAETGETVIFRGAVFLQQLGRGGSPSGAFDVIPLAEFNERFTRET
jgi:hypothetical protein